MKIFFCLASLGSGGAERVVSLLADKMAEQGHHIEILCLKYNDVYYHTSDKVKVILAKQYVKNNLSELFWLRRYIKEGKPDVVIAFTEGVYCFTICALLGSGIPIIASERLDPSAMSATRKIFKRIFLPYVDWLVVQTKKIKEYFPPKIQRKTSIIYNPVNEEVFKTPSDVSGLQKENRIISVARLFPQKNQQMMIRAFAKISDKFPDWKLVIFGEGPLREELESLVEGLDLKDRVLLPGRTEQVIDELRKSKIFCLSSDYEGLSNAMIEAYCIGLPIISTRVSGTDELVYDRESGLLVDIGDEQKMADAMKIQIHNVETSGKTKYGINASKFQLDNIINEWYQVINLVVK
jgi:glycosyltransferase involved in cell wall biosynthesis